MAESRVEYLSSRGMCTDDPSLMIVVDVEWLKPLIKELIISKSKEMSVFN